MALSLACDWRLHKVMASQSDAKFIPHINERVCFRGMDKTLMFAVQLELIFLRRIFIGKYALINQDIGILGRDILNEVSLLLDGPNLTWDEQ
jgi:hypothetical protein